MTREQIFELIDQTIFPNTQRQISEVDLNNLLKTIYDNAPVPSVGFEHYIGESFGGGVIFHLWKDSEGIEHGLIVDNGGISANGWSNVSGTSVGIGAQSSWDGISNTNAIIAQSGHTDSAALRCRNSTKGGFNDWYLPSLYELQLLYLNLFDVERAFSQLEESVSLFPTTFYFSSTETAASSVWACTFSNGAGLSAANVAKNNGSVAIRAIRQF